MLAHTGISEDIVRALAHNNNIAESGKVDASAAQKKYVANAAKRMEGLLDRDKVGEGGGGGRDEGDKAGREGYMWGEERGRAHGGGGEGAREG